MKKKRPLEEDPHSNAGGGPDGGSGPNGGGPSAAGTPDQPLDFDPLVYATQCVLVSASVGGTVETESRLGELQVPGGSLLRDTEICINVFEPPDKVEGFETFGIGCGISPGGTEFNPPSALTLRHDPPDLDDEQEVIAISRSHRGTEILPVISTSDTETTISVPHLSEIYTGISAPVPAGTTLPSVSVGGPMLAPAFVTIPAGGEADLHLRLLGDLFYEATTPASTTETLYIQIDTGLGFGLGMGVKVDVEEVQPAPLSANPITHGVTQSWERHFGSLVAEVRDGTTNHAGILGSIAYGSQISRKLAPLAAIGYPEEVATIEFMVPGTAGAVTHTLNLRLTLDQVP